MKPVLSYPYFSYRATTFRLRLPTGEQLMILKCYSPNLTPVVHDNLYMYVPASNFNIQLAQWVAHMQGWELFSVR